MRFALRLIALALALAGCTGTAPLPPKQAVMNFVTVVDRVAPIAERECRADAPKLRCDFEIVVDGRLSEPPNAYQSIAPSGRPVITFTLALIADAHNADELAFIMGHEAAHHIEQHLARQRRNAIAGAQLLGDIAAAHGADARGRDTAQRLGAALGSVVFSKDMELEADALGTVIAAHAGYDPVLGARYFARIPDPGDSFLGSHPPNAERQQVVADVAAGL